MEVHFTPERKPKLDRMARDIGRRSAALPEDAVVGLFGKPAFTRKTPARRNDDLESVRAEPMDGAEAWRRLPEQPEEHRRRRPI